MGDFLLQGEVAELRDQLAEQHKAFLRFLGHMKDRLPEITAWDLFAAAALPACLTMVWASMKPTGGGGAGMAIAAVTSAAEIADALLVERTKREAAALEAKKAKTDKE